MASVATQGLCWSSSSLQGVAIPLEQRCDWKEFATERQAGSHLVSFSVRLLSGFSPGTRLEEGGNGREGNSFQIRTWPNLPLPNCRHCANTGNEAGSVKLKYLQHAAAAASPGKYLIFPRKTAPDLYRKGSKSAQPFVNQIGSKAQRKLRHLLFTELGEIRSLTLMPGDALWTFLQDALRQQNWRGALDVFAAMKEIQGYQADIRIYTMMVRIMAKAKQPFRAFQLFEEMQEVGCGWDVFAFTALLDAYGRSGLLEQAVSVFEKMKDTPACKPNVYTYNCMINAYGRAQLWSKIDALTKEMDDLGVKPLDMTFNVLISAYGKSALYEQMESVFERMQKAGCKPDVFTFNTMIDAYGKGSQYSKMEWTYRRMLMTKCLPDILTFSSLMYAYKKAGLDEKLERALESMCTAGCRPDVKAYSLLIDIYGKQGKLEKMEATFKEMQSAGCRANVVTYTGILDAYGKAALFTQMEGVWLSMNSIHLKPDVSAYVTMLSAYGKGGMYDKMEMVFLELKAAAKDMKSIGPKPGCHAYNVVIDAYGKGKLIGKMERAFEEMQQTGHQPSVMTYTSLIDAYGKAALPNKMERVYVTMKVMGCEPNIQTYGCLIDGYGRLGMVEKAEKVVEDMREAGYRLDLVTYTCIIDAYGRAKDFQTMAAKFSEMTAAGFEPSSVTIGVMLSSLNACYSRDDASIVIQCLLGCPVFRVVGCLLQEGDHDCLLMEETEKLFDKLQQETGPPLILFDALVGVLWSFGWHQRAIRVLNLGRSKGTFPHTQVHSGTGIVLDLHLLSSNVAQVMLLAWLTELKAELLGGKVNAAQVSVVTGWGRRSKVGGESPLKTAVRLRLASMGSPFRVPRDNVGRLVAPLEQVSRWLLSEKVATYLELRNAQHPGPGHTLKQGSSFKQS